MTEDDTLLGVAEQSVLGSLMIDSDSWDKITGILTADSFYHPSHKVIFRAIAALHKDYKPVDILTVSELITNLNEEVDLFEIALITKNTLSSGNIVAHANMIKHHYLMRSFGKIAEEAVHKSRDPGLMTAKELISQTEMKLFKLYENEKSENRYHSISDVLTNCLDIIDQRFSNQSNLIGMESGFTELDFMTSGLQKGEMIVIAGRPSMGKSTLALNIASHVAIKECKSVVIFSLEMSKELLGFKIAASLGGMNLSALRGGNIDGDTNWARLMSAVSLISNKKLMIIDQVLTVEDVRADARSLFRSKDGLDLIVIDYLSLLSTESKSENKTQEVTEISRVLKLLAMELNIPIIVLSQLNRNSEARADKRPTMSDLRNSGSVEQDADIVILVHRDKVKEGVADIIVDKNRNGATGDFILRFEGEYGRFLNI